MQVQLSGQPAMHEHQEALSLSAAYIGDLVSAVSGGLRNGSAYLGMANFKVEIETERAGWWSGGKFFLNAANTHGATPSRDFLGDYQIASNIEAGDHAFIQELWFRQTFGSLHIILGVQDLNVEFAGCRSGELFLNSSFAIQPTITTNIPASVFPLTSLGLTVIWSSSDNLTWRTAVYDGAPTVFEQNPYNLSWSLRNSEGMINVFEFEYSAEKEVLKFGAFHHDHLYEPGELQNELVYEHNMGFYSVADLQLMQMANGSILNLFGQTGYSSRIINKNYWFGSVGLRCSGLFASPETDEFGLAIAHAGMRSHKDETTIELTYKCLVNNSVYIQPDIQYIFNPAGTVSRLGHSLVCTIRYGFIF